MSQISLRNIRKVFKTTAALDGIDLDVADSEFVAILGPSGSGKTTLLNIIAGLTSPTDGTILVDGTDITGLAPDKRNVGLVFQSYALFPNMNVEQNVAFPLTVRGVDKSEISTRVNEALRLVRLEGYGKRRAHELSGGQQQRVALARAFVFQPAMMLLDEPLGALDRKLREQVQVELHQLQRSLGITTLLVTHDQEEALSLADRIAVLDDGRIQQIGTPQEVYLRPTNRFVADFLGTANLLDGAVEQTASGPVLVLADDSRMPVSSNDQQTNGPATALVRPERVQISTNPQAGGMPVTLKDAIYLARYVRLMVERADGSPMIVDSPEPIPGLEPGDQFSVSWRPDDVWLLPQAESTDNTPTTLRAG